MADSSSSNNGRFKLKPYVDSVIRGHHIYKAVWTPYIGEKLSLELEHGTSHDFYATTVKKDGLVVGRVPRQLSKLFWTFLSNGGQISSEVTGRREVGGWRFHALTKFRERMNSWINSRSHSTKYAHVNLYVIKLYSGFTH